MYCALLWSDGKGAGITYTGIIYMLSASQTIFGTQIQDTNWENLNLGPQYFTVFVCVKNI